MKLSRRSKRQLGVAFAGVILTLGFYVFLLALPHLMLLFGYDRYRIPSQSMNPNILVNDFILTKNVTKMEDLNGGDVIVFSFSSWTALDFQEEENPDCVLGLKYRYLAKRIIAVGGDIVEFDEGSLSVNGIVISSVDDSESIEALNNGRQYRIISPLNYRKLMLPVEDGHVFVMGDNRPKSADSRCWGAVPFSAIKGKVERVVYSEGEEGTRWERIGEKVN